MLRNPLHIAVACAWTVALVLCALGALTDLHRYAFVIAGVVATNVASVLTIIDWLRSDADALDEAFEVGREVGKAEKDAQYRAARKLLTAR